MRRAGNIFEQESYRGIGVRTMPGVTITLIICSVLSGLTAFCIIANFGAVSARIAIFVANLLSSGFPILIVIAAVVYFTVRLKWKLRRSFGGDKHGLSGSYSVDRNQTVPDRLGHSRSTAGGGQLYQI